MKRPKMPRELHIPLNDELAALGGVDSLAALVDEPAAPASASILFLHGAGLDMQSAFMEHVATAWCRLGARVLRFDQPYMERARRTERRRPPDRMPVILAATRAALAFGRARWPDGSWVLAGKSMGARAATLVAAGEEDALGNSERSAASAIVCLGYPLHPPRRPDALRVAHFPRVDRPTLFVQGTRDPFGGPAELKSALCTYGATFELHGIEGGDHDFQVPKRAGATREEVLDALADHAWRFALRHVTP